MTTRQRADSLHTFAFKHSQTVDELSNEDAVLQSKDLFASSRVRRIEHNGEYYYLRLTRSGKLILSK